MNNPYAAYMETTVLSASPLELVCMMYAGAIEAVRDARRHLAAGRIAERSAAVTHAVEIVTELNRSLDLSAGELAVKLAALYDYIQRRLLDANFRQADDGLAEALSLLETLAEGWNGISGQDAGAAEAERAPASVLSGGSDVSSPWNPVLPEPAHSYPAGGWSF
jgi:flagellar protein FliS